MGRESRSREARGLQPYLVVREIGLEVFEAKVCAHIEQGYLPAGGVVCFPGKSSALAGAVAHIVYVQAMVLLPPEDEISEAPVADA